MSGKTFAKVGWRGRRRLHRTSVSIWAGDWVQRFRVYIGIGKEDLTGTGVIWEFIGFRVSQKNSGIFLGGDHN